MIRRLYTQLLIRPEDLQPAYDGFEVIGAFNPGVAQSGRDTLLLVRVAERPRPRDRDHVDLPRWSNGQIVIDRYHTSEIDLIDPRVVRIRETGLVRLTFLSHLRLAISRDGRSIDSISGPVLEPEHPEEEFGVEDPRITPLDNAFLVSCVCVSRHGAATELLSTSDCRTFERRGTAFCPENKDVVLFPERIGGHYAALHRPNGATPFTRPEIWFARSPDLVHWGEHAPVTLPTLDWQTGRVGGGAPPIRVESGWLEIFHGNVRPARPGEIGQYFGAAMLLDAEDPSIVRAFSREAVLAPQEDFELHGFAGGVVFPTGVIEADDVLLVYYGAADACTAVAAISRQELLDSLA